MANVKCPVAAHCVEWQLTVIPHNNSQFEQECEWATCSAVKRGSSLMQETMIECISSCSRSSSSSSSDRSKDWLSVFCPLGGGDEGRNLGIQYFTRQDFKLDFKSKAKTSKTDNKRFISELLDSRFLLFLSWQEWKLLRLGATLPQYDEKWKRTERLQGSQFTSQLAHQNKRPFQRSW